MIIKNQVGHPNEINVLTNKAMDNLYKAQAKELKSKQSKESPRWHIVLANAIMIWLWIITTLTYMIKDRERMPYLYSQINKYKK